MKTVVCGLGKCGSRMIIDLNAMIYGGDYSFKLRIPESGVYKKSIFDSFRDALFGKGKARAKYIPEDEVPKMHLGDPDNQNEVVNYCSAPTDDNKHDPSREALRNNMVCFRNYNGACGQYHIIGEQVMINLMTNTDTVKNMLLNQHIIKNSKDSASCFFLMFSAGGGTGCGTSTVLAEYVAEYAKREYANLLVAGIAALPGNRESDNYKVSAGRFLTKFLSSERATNFDTVITVGNSIMENIERDEQEVQSEANIFAANIILSIVNSSSRYNRSPVNTDGPELRKNIKGLGYFCFAQKESGENSGSMNVELLANALSPVSTMQKSGNTSFTGVSIDLAHPKYFPKERWDELVSNIMSVKDDIATIEKGDQKGLSSLLRERFPDPKSQLPLAMRSCDNVVVLRGIPSEDSSSHWEQTILVSLLEELFPKATIHYYSTYHQLPQHTLSLIPSGYMSYELMEFISEYLFNVWETDESKTSISKLLVSPQPVDAEQILDKFGSRERFDFKYQDFSQICERTSGLFGLDESSWDDRYITAENVASMIDKVKASIDTAKRKPKVADDIDWDDEAFDI